MHHGAPGVHPACAGHLCRTFAGSSFFQGTLDGIFVMRHDLVLFGQHHSASRIFIHVILLLYSIGTSLHLRIKHVKHIMF